MAYSWDPEFGKPHPEEDQSLDQSIISLDSRPIEDWTTKEVKRVLWIDDRPSDRLDPLSNFLGNVQFQQLLDEKKPIKSRSRILIHDRTRIKETGTSSRYTKAPLTATDLLRYLKNV